MATPTWFDKDYYLNSKLAQLVASGDNSYADIVALDVAIEAAGYDAFSHFQAFSLLELTSPNEYFNAGEYLTAKAAQANATAVGGKTNWTADSIALAIKDAGIATIWDHFVEFGWKEGVNPSNAFDVSTYFADKLAQLQADEPAVGWTDASMKAAFEAAGLDPVTHFQMFGTIEDLSVTGVPAAEQVGGGSPVPGDPAVGETFSLTADAASVNEGATVTFTVVAGKPNFTYSYELTGVDAADVVDGLLTGSITTDTNGSATFTVALVADRATDGVDTLKATLPNTGLSATVTVNDTSLDNVAPVAEDATGAATEAGAVVTGQLLATDAEDDALTFAPVAAVDGLTLNDDGSYSFDPSLNTAAQALTYKSDPLDVVAEYTVTDAQGATDTGTLTITVTPKPLTFTLVPSAAFVEEGSTVTYKLVASEPVQDGFTGTIQISAGDGSAGQTLANDFGSGSLNPVNVTIAAGETESTVFTLTPTNDAATEAPESYTVTGTIDGKTLTLTGEVRDPSSVGGLGQTFTLTTGIDTIPGLVGSAGSTGTDGNDTIVALVDKDITAPDNSTLTALDQINGGLGTNSLTLNVTGGALAVVDLDVATITNVQTINARGTGAIVMDLTSNAGITGVTALNTTQSLASTLTAANTTDIGVSGATGAITVNGGKNVTVTDAGTNNAISVGVTTVNKGTITVTDTKVGSGNIAINGGTDVTATLSGVTTAITTIGAATAATGAVVVNSTGAAFVAATDATLGNIAITGGKTISVTQVATSDASAAAADKIGGTVTQGNVTIVAAATTTDVTVKQDATKAETLATDKTGGATETASAKFTALAIGNTITMGGLTFTATAAMTAAEAAAAFANLVPNAPFVAPASIAAGDTQAGGAASKGNYTGAFTGWTSAAASGDTVVFTSTAPNTNPVDLANTGTAGTVTITTTTGALPNAGAAGGVMGVTAGVVDITGGAALANVTVDGYAAAAANRVQGATNTALATVNLLNGGNFTVASAASALALNLTNVSGTVGVTAGTTTLNATVNGAGFATLTSGSATAVNVSGTGFVSGTTAVGGLTAATAINTTGMTAGAAFFTLNSAATTYAGGAGADSVTFSNTTAATKALDLGIGNDTLTFATGSAVPTAVLKGGDGDDTISLTASNAVTLSGSTAFAEKLDSFERLAVTGATGVQAIDLGKLGFTNHVTVAGVGGAGTLTLTDLANNGTVVLTTAAITSGVTVAVKDAGTAGHTTDVLNVINQVAAGGTLTAAKVETINLTQNTADGALTLTAADATSLNITASKALNLTLTGSTHLTSIDGNASTAAITVTSLNTTSATTIKGGSGADVLTAATGSTADVLIGGAGNDVLVANAGLSTLTGDTGNDVFRIATASLNVNSYATITDFAAGDLLQIAGATSFASAKVTLGDTAVFQDYANAAMNALDQATDGTDVAAGWFQFGGNTYVVADAGAESTTFVNGQDFIVKLAGVVDLTNASFNNIHDTIAL